MFQEFEDVVLVVDLPDYGLQVGDVGAIVDIDKTGRQVTRNLLNDRPHHCRCACRC